MRPQVIPQLQNVNKRKNQWGHEMYISPIADLLFHLSFIFSKFVRLHGTLLFQNKHICLAIYGPQCESLMSYLQVKMNEAEMLCFHSKLPDQARGTKSEHLGNVFVFVWAYKMKCTCFENNSCPSLLAKSQKKVYLPKRLATGETSAILCRRYDNCLDIANLYS